MNEPFRVETSRTCDFDIPTGTPYGRRCGRPAGWKWHRDDDEFFCWIHKDGVPSEYRNEAHYRLFWSTVDEQGAGDWVAVQDLKVGDLIDLEGDPYADPEYDSMTFEYEYARVGGENGEPGELESADCYRLDYDTGACGFPPDHRVVRVNATEVAK